eukprot:7279833-Prymnesium_polylepis.1
MLQAIERCSSSGSPESESGEPPGLLARPALAIQGWGEQTQKHLQKVANYAKALAADLQDPLELASSLREAQAQITQLQDALERTLVKLTLAEKEASMYESALRWRAAADKANAASRASQIHVR